MAYSLQTISAQCYVSYRNQPFVLQSKTNDWFLYETQHGCLIHQITFLSTKAGLYLLIDRPTFYGILFSLVDLSPYLPFGYVGRAAETGMQS